MTRIDFYVLKEDSLVARQTFACKLVQKAHLLNHQIYIHCANEADAVSMDKLLWSFSDTSFLPHRVMNSGGAECSIEIGFHDDINAPDSHHDLLINLAYGVPPFFSRFERMAEIVVQEPNVLTATRANYRFYNQKHYPLHKHNLAQVKN